MEAPSLLNCCGFFKKETTSSSSSFASGTPATSSKVTVSPLSPGLMSLSLANLFFFSSFFLAA
jgi:hypothetical protein